MGGIQGKGTGALKALGLFWGWRREGVGDGVGKKAAPHGMRVWGQLTEDLVCWANGFYALRKKEFFFFPSSYFYSW